MNSLVGKTLQGGKYSLEADGGDGFVLSAGVLNTTWTVIQEALWNKGFGASTSRQFLGNYWLAGSEARTFQVVC